MPFRALEQSIEKKRRRDAALHVLAKPDLVNGKQTALDSVEEEGGDPAGNDQENHAAFAPG